MYLPFKRLQLNRTAWLKLHLYLALSVGSLFAIIGFTGSLSVYREELDELLNPELVIEDVQGKYQTLDKIMAAITAAHPDRHGSWTLEMPRSKHSMLTAWYQKPRETFFELYAPLMVSVNPYSAEVVTSRFWGDTLTTWLMDVHTQFRLNQFGWNMVGCLGILLTLSVGSGFYLWWPGIVSLIKSFTINYRNSWQPLVLDLHRLLGIGSGFILLTLALSGILLSYPKILETLTGPSAMAHGETGRTIASTAIPNHHPVSLEAAKFMALSSFPKAELRRITTPTGESGVYLINFRQNTEINRKHPYTTVWVDRWSGHIKEVRNPMQFSSMQTFSTWIWPLHTGEAMGPASRVIWFLSGQSLFLLYVTGLLRWLFRSNWIKDRPVDVKPCKLFLLQCLTTLKRAGRQTILFAVFFNKQFAPQIILNLKRICFRILQLMSSLLSRQKKLDRP
jgi:uncharacterized iron-regulated membrane protein